MKIPMYNKQILEANTQKFSKNTLYNCLNFVHVHVFSPKKV